MGKLLKGVVKFTVAAAAIGGVCYAFKDQIKESKIYKDYDVDTKINKVKTTIKEKMPKAFSNEEDIVDDDEIFFDDMDMAVESPEKNYVSIVPEQTADTTEDSKTEAPAESENTSEEDSTVPTIEL